MMYMNTYLSKIVLKVENVHETKWEIMEQRQDELLKALRSMDQRVVTLEQQNREMTKKIEELTQENKQMKRQMSATRIHPEKVTSAETFTQHVSLGCVSDVLTLYCPDNRTIFTTSGIYGQYAYPCAADCCAPNPLDDCGEIVEENRLEDWLAIKYYCDNKTSCEYENGGSPIDQCEEGYIADYLQIFYDCLPHDVDAPVGFSANANTGAPTTYSVGEIVVFDGLISNLGGHYNPASSTFTCPYDGVYMFNVNLRAYADDRIDAELYLNDSQLANMMAYADGTTWLYAPASSLVITSCESGDVVWVRCNVEGNLHATWRHNTFSGYLLQMKTID